MYIAIQAADLDNNRIDGTRVYLWNLLKIFGKISPEEFLIYHRNEFNPSLKPAEFGNYTIKKLKKPPIYWTQTRFALEIWRDNPDKLWMPMQALPFFRRSELETIVTIHDLAFKYFPEYFPKKDLRRLNLFTDYAIRHSNKIIAVSASTKNDILKFYPGINERKIRVIYHGFDPELFQREIRKNESGKTLSRFGIRNPKFLLYVGAIQPRKNLKTLIAAFEAYKKENSSKVKLVISGSKAWMWEEVVASIGKSEFKNDIILTGRVSFDELAIIYRNAAAFVFPSIYEGFGIPILEAFASKVPVICAKNSSLEEIGKDAVLFFETGNPRDLKNKISQVLEDENVRRDLVEKGSKRVKEFSWEKCAQETLDYIVK